MRYLFHLLVVHSFLFRQAWGEQKEQRIAGGEISERSSRPFQVALYTKVSSSSEVGFCGGSLVHPQWVLTSAHCVYHKSVPVDDVQAILGAYSLYDRYENGRRIVKVEEIVVHPGWEPATFDNDLALLKLPSAMQLSDVINVVQLPYRNISNYNFAGMAGTASGWGIPAEGVTIISPTNREKVMTVMTDTLCSKTFLNELPHNVVCGYNLQGGTCKGDNGGPMTIFYSTTQEVILIGVTSFISACGCNIELPSVFTRVQRYLDWIGDVTGLDII